ncbi:hypothetical protein LCGC14_2972810, partial [marine sediment metagenome]
IVAWVENPQASIFEDSLLTEYRLDYRSLTLDLSEEKFKDPGSLQITDFTLVGAPYGTSIQSVTDAAITGVTINLAFTGRDFDADSTNFRVEIDSSVLIQTETLTLGSDSLTIFAYVENPVAALSADTILHENSLGVRTLTIDLTEERFTDYTTLQTNDFVLVNAPGGLSIQSITGQAPTQVDIELQYTGIDFDVDSVNFAVDIASTELVQTTSGFLRSVPLIIEAYQENPVATLSSDSALREQRLDYRTLTVNLTEEMFSNYLTLGIADISLSGAPSGISIQSVTGISPYEADIELSYVGIDFDDDSSNFVLNINNSVLIQTESGILTSNALNIQAYVESPVATLSSGSALSEYVLDQQILTIDFTEEQF